MRIELTVTAVRGRRIEIEFEAFDGVERIGYGTHGRVVVDREAFQARVEDRLGVLVDRERDG